MPFKKALVQNSHATLNIPNPLPGLEWALVVNRHVEAVKATAGDPPEIEYLRDITDEGVANIIRRRKTILELGFDDKPSGIISSPAMRCCKTGHGCGGLSFDQPDQQLYVPLNEWGWAQGWPKDENASDEFYALLNANKKQPANFFYNGQPRFGTYLTEHSIAAWGAAVRTIGQRRGGLFFGSGHSPTQDVMCAEATLGSSLDEEILNTHVSYGQGWWIGSPDGEQIRFGWMLQ